METEMLPNFSSEEERNEFIDGDRETRLKLDVSDVDTALGKLEDLSRLINEKTKRLTDFYRRLDERLSRYELGCPFILKAPDDDALDSSYKLCHSEDADGEMYFWRLGYRKLGSTWGIVAYKYRIEYAQCAPVHGPDPKHVLLEDQTVRLTHASRDLRIQAAHRVRDFILKFLENVKYNESSVDTALQRVEGLESLLN